MEEIKEKINGIFNSLNVEEWKELLRHYGTRALINTIVSRGNILELEKERTETIALSEIDRKYDAVIVIFPYECKEE